MTTKPPPAAGETTAPETTPRTEPRTAAPAPAARASRAFAPDIARGLMLLAVMIANTTFYITGREPGLLMRPTDPGPADRVVDVLSALFIDNRAYPMFAFLFAYGVHQIVSRQAARGVPWRRTAWLLTKRDAWLLGIGVLHTVLLFPGDIITSYALCGFVLILLVRAPGWALWSIFAFSFLWNALVSTADALSVSGLLSEQELDAQLDSLTASVEAPTASAGLLARIELLPLSLLNQPFFVPALLAPMSLGLLLARRSVLERPWERPRLVATLGWTGLACAVLGGAPLAWGLAFGFEPSPMWLLASSLSNATGVLAGVGWPCLIALALARLQRRHDVDPSARPGPAGRALQALGKRSMSGYLAQSVFSVLLFPAYSLDLGSRLGTFGMTAAGVGVWLLTLSGAVLLERADRPGPMEWLLRRLVYGRPRRVREDGA